MNQVKQLITSVRSYRNKTIMVEFFLSKTVRLAFFVSLSILFVITSYVWFVSYGRWTYWTTISNKYDQLATAFEHGSLALEREPDPALLALPNPYDPSARANLKYPLDLSLYKGKYYLYFGPTPALILAIIKPLVTASIGDQYLVFVFTSGIFIFESLLLLEIWKQFFQNVPVWVMSICIIFIGWISPFPWLLMQARVYEAAISGGQFFFLAGLYFIFTAMHKEAFSLCKIFIGSVFWVLAIGSRLTLALPIGFLVLMVTLLLIRNFRQNKLLSNIIYAITCLVIPLIIGIAVLGWYNWARFNSIFETGFSYQLAGPNLQKYHNVLFSPVYIVPNLYDYLVMRPGILKTFPFIRSVAGTGASKFPFILLPKVYFSDSITGMIFSTPFFLLVAGVALFFVLIQKRKKENEIKRDDDKYLLTWMIISLSGSFLFEFGTIVSCFWVVTRYAADFMPPLALLSIIGFLQGYRHLVERPIRLKLYQTFGIGLMVISNVNSILLALSANAQHFKALIP